MSEVNNNKNTSLLQEVNKETTGTNVQEITLLRKYATCYVSGVGLLCLVLDCCVWCWTPPAIKKPE